MERVAADPGEVGIPEGAFRDLVPVVDVGRETADGVRDGRGLQQNVEGDGQGEVLVRGLHGSMMEAAPENPVIRHRVV